MKGWQRNKDYKRIYNQQNLEAAIQSYKLTVIRKKEYCEKEVQSKTKFTFYVSLQ